MGLSTDRALSQALDGGRMEKTVFQQLEGTMGSLFPLAKLQPLTSVWVLDTLSEWQ